MSVAPAPASRRPTARIAARAAVALLLLALLAGCAGKKENANRRIEAVARSSPTKAKVLLNNDDFVVLEFTLQPGDFVPPYWGGKRVVYPLTSHRLKKIEEGEEPYVEQVAEGEARWHDNEFLSVENVGEDPARYIVFSRREAVMEAPADSATVKRMMGADPEHADILLENDHVYVIRYRFPAEAYVPPHKRANRVFYTLQPAAVEYDSELQGTVQRHYEEGEAYWQQADTYSIRNVGNTDGEFIIVSFRD